MSHKLLLSRVGRLGRAESTSRHFYNDGEIKRERRVPFYFGAKPVGLRLAGDLDEI